MLQQPAQALFAQHVGGCSVDEVDAELEQPVEQDLDVALRGNGEIARDGQSPGAADFERAKADFRNFEVSAAEFSGFHARSPRERNQKWIAHCWAENERIAREKAAASRLDRRAQP